MAKQNEVSLSALHRARLRRQRPSEVNQSAEDAAQDVIVPSFLWEPVQEGSTPAASWKEDPLPVRPRRSALPERSRDDERQPGHWHAPEERDAPHEDVSREDDELLTSQGGHAYVYTPGAGRHALSHLAAEPEYDDEQEPSPRVGTLRPAEQPSDTAPSGHERAALDESFALPPLPDDSTAAVRQEAVSFVRTVPADEEEAFRNNDVDSVIESRVGREADNTADGAEPGQISFCREGTAAGDRSGASLADDMEFPNAWSNADRDGVPDAALASGEEDLRELKAALAARGIPLRRERQAARLPEAVDDALPPDTDRISADVRAAAAADNACTELPPSLPETVPTAEPEAFSSTPDTFLTATAAEEVMVPDSGETSGTSDPVPADSGRETPSDDDGRSGPPEPPRTPESPDAGRHWLRRFAVVMALLVAIGGGLLLPYSFWWVYADGDVAVERAVAAQAGGRFAIFGSGVSQDFVDYKLRLYEAVKPEIVVVGSSRVMQFRGTAFRRPFVNVGGTAGNLSVLRSTIDAMLKIHRPQAVIIGLDFWWFSENWQKDPFVPEPPTSGSYVYDLETLKAPWKWLLEGKIGWKEFFAPLTGGFREDRFGIMAQKSDDGFASDGSWHYTADVTGQQRPFDYQFGDTLKQVRYGIKAFAPAPRLSEAHLDAFAEIYCRLKSRGIQTFVFIAPLSATVLDAMRERQAAYPHLFSLYTALMERGIDVMDFTDPRKFGSSDCEFVDGFHGGEVTYARILRDLVDRYHALVTYVDVERVNRVLKEWKGHATVYDERVTLLPEVDFMNMSCPKKQR